jgi:hypothetical protein
VKAFPIKVLANQPNDKGALLEPTLLAVRREALKAELVDQHCDLSQLAAFLLNSAHLSTAFSSRVVPKPTIVDGRAGSEHTDSRPSAVGYRIRMGNSDYGRAQVKMVTKTLDQLRQEMHAAVDEVLNRFGTLSPVPKESADEPNVAVGGEVGAWTYEWPDKQMEQFTSGRSYDLSGSEGSLRVRLARTVRRAWGRDRGRVIVFQELGNTSRSFYPLVEFVETDDHGSFASPVPDPTRPRALLAEASKLPTRFERKNVVRADSVFRTIDKGPSLRLVVAEDDETEMVRHGYWVARVRGRL